MKIRTEEKTINLKISKRYELATRYDTCQSFYGKAFIEEDKQENIILKSYDTIVLFISKEKEIFINKDIESDLLYSNTTQRHIKETIKQFTERGTLTKKDLLKLPGFKVLVL